MPETPFTPEPAKALAEQLPQEQLPLAPPVTTSVEVIKNDAGKARVASPVASTVLHERGGRVPEIFHKGDVYTNPSTGARQVIEDVRGEGEKQIISYTKELAPGVREEPRRAIRQLPRINFEVQKEVGGLSEKTPAFAQEFEAIDDACQEVFAAVNKAYVLQKKQGSITPEADKLMDRLEPLSEKMGEIVDAWNVLWAEDSNNESTLRAQLEELKQLVVDIPSELVKPFPVLMKVQKEIQSKRTDEKVNDPDGKESEKNIKKRTKPKSFSGNKEEKKTAKRGRGRPRKDDMSRGDSLSAAVTDKSDGQYRPPEVEGNESLKKRIETEEGNAELFRWIGGIRQQLQDLDQLASKIFRRKLTQEFKNALFAVSTDHEALARTKGVGDKGVRMVSGELDDIESSLSPKHRWSSQEEYDEWFSAKVMRLQNYAKLYDEILRTGERVLSVKHRKTLAGKNGYQRVDRGEVVEMTSTERALKTVGTTYEGLEPGVQQALLQGVERIAAVTRATVQRADAALLAKGVTDRDERRERIAATFAPKVGEAVRGIMSHAGFRAAEIERLTRTLLIAGPQVQDNQVPRLGYDRQK